MTDKVDRNMQDPAEAGHDDVNVRAVMLTAAVLAVVTVVVYVVVYLLFWHFESREARRTPRLFPLASDQPRLPPAPRLQPDPAQDLKALRQRDEELLTTYGWVNEKTGIVRIPIDRAMKLLLEQIGRASCRERV